jgi:hypothetical protein
MSESVNQALSNDEDLDMEFLQFDEENYAYQDFNSNDGDLQGNVGAETGALSLGQLQQEVIGKYVEF